MASNKTKLAAANAKSAFDFDDDFGSMFDDGDIGGKKKSPVAEFMAGFKDGVIDVNKNKSLLRAFITNGVPKGYDRLFGVYDQFKDGATSLKDHLEKTNPGDLQYLFKKAEGLVNSNKGRLSQNSYDKINNVLSSKVDQYKYQIEANQNQARLAIRRQKAEDEQTIKDGLGEDLRGAIDQGTVVQRSLFNKGQENDQRRWDIDRIERGLRDQIDNQHQQKVARGLAQAVDSLTRLAGYNEQVNYDFQRKGLELQFRSYMALRDLTKMQEASLEMQNKAFQALVRNTGLPDHLKSSMKDLVGMNMRQGMAQAGSSMVGKTLSSFLGSYGSNVQNRVNNRASSALSGITQSMQMGEGMGDMWNQRYRLAGGFAADGLHSVMRSTVAPIIGRMARPKMTQLSNKYGGGRHNQAGYALDNIPALMQEFVNNGQNAHGGKGILQNMLRPFAPQFGFDTASKAGNFQTIGQHTAFNQLSQRSLTEVLPGFQARILRELRMLRTGNENTPMEVFDITKGMFTTSKMANDNLQNRIVSKSTTRMVSAQINDSLDSIDKEGQLSPGARKALAERLMRDSSSGKRFDPMKYGSKYGYKEGVSKETVKELEDFFKGQYERDADGKFADTAGNHEKRKAMSDAFLNIRNVSRDPAAEIHRMLEAGNTTGLRELGIVTTEDGVDRINYQMLWQMMSADVSSRHGGEGKRWNDASGDTTSANFVGPQFPGKFSATAQSKVVDFLNTDPAARAAAALRGGAGKAKDVMDQFKSDPMQFMRDQGNKVKGSAQAAADAVKGGGLPAIMEHFSVQEKLDFAKALLNNVVDKEPPAMREARLQMAQAIINSINTGKEKGQALIDSSTGQAAIAQGSKVLQLGHDKIDQAKQSEAAGIVDLHLEGAKDVAIRAVDMIQGKLVDVNTGKVIKNASDITGEVLNSLGQQVLSAEEAAKGLYNDRDQLMVKAREKIDRIAAVIKTHTQGAIGAAKEKADDFKDWCLEGSDKIVIRSRELLDGAYLDAESGKPIFSLDDIKGDIVDHYGRTVATAQELAKGLISATDGKRMDLTAMKNKAAGLFGKVMHGNTTQNVISAAKMVGGVAWRLARNTVARMTGDRDAYLPGNVKPTLTVEKLKEGMYFDETGKALRSFDEVKGPVFDENNEPLLDKDELKKLVDVNGKKHKIAKNRGLIRRMVKGAVGGYWNLTKKYYSALGGEIGNDLKAGFKTATAPIGAFSKRQLANLSTTDQVLVQIRDAIRETVPKKNRKGSWMAKEEAKTAAEKAQDAAENKDKKETKGLFSKLSSSLGGMWAAMTGKKKGEEEEEEGGGIMDTVTDGLSTAADVKDLTGGRGKKGRFGKFGKKLAGSRAGQMATRLGSSAIGRMAATAGGQALMRGGAMLGTALAGLVSAPVLIGAAVVGGVAVASYFTYKYFAGVKGEFMSVRMLQYGITSTRQRHKILKLEELFEKTSMRGQNPQISINGDSGSKMIDIMGFSKDDPEAIARFAKWMDKRFKPVFCTWLKAVDTVGKTQMSLRDIEDKLDEPLKGTLVKEITMPYGNDGVFGMRENPFGDVEPLDDTQEETKERITALAEKYKVDPDKEKKDLPGKEAPSKEAASNKETAALVGATAAAAAKTAVDEAKTTGKAANDTKDAAAKSVADKVSSIAKGAGAVATGAAAVNSITPIPMAAQSVSALDAVRARAYGVEKMTRNDMEALIAMETRVDLQSKMRQDGTYAFEGDMEKLITAAGGLFGLNTADHGPDRVKFVNWLLGRFMPVCKAFLSTIRPIYRGKPSDASTAMKLGDQVTAAKAVLGAVSPEGGSVWKVNSIFEVVGSLDDLKKLADLDLKALTDQADAVLSTPTQSAGAQAAGAAAAAGGKSFMDGVMDSAGKALSNAKDAVVDHFTRQGKALASVATSVTNGVKNVAQSAATSIATAAQNTYEFFGGTSAELTKGNGGQWEQVPMPTSKDPKGSSKTLQVVAQMTGVPYEFLMVFCGLESNFNWEVKAGAGGSATGWFQFINSTWDWMVQSYGSKYGFPQDKIPQRPLRLDPRLNALMGAEYMKITMEKVQKAFNRAPTDIDLYLGHFLGPDTAIKWLRLPQNTLGATAFPREAAANPSIFYSKGRQPRTLAEIMAEFDKRMAKFRALAQGLGGTGPAVPLTLEEVEKKQAEEKAKAIEADAKKEGGFIAGVSAMPGGPSATGSTPTNAGTGGAAPTPTAAAATTPASGTVGVMAPNSQPSAEPASAGPGSNAASQATQAASAAKDQQRAKEVKQQTEQATALNDVQQQQLQTQKEMLQVLKEIAGKQSGSQQGNSMPKQQSRSANKDPFPVNV